MNEKRIKIPTTCALLFMLMLVAAVLTYVVPAGKYNTEVVGKVTKVIAGTYHVIPSTPQGPWAACMAVAQGFTRAARLMWMTMFCGGAVAILEKTGCINAAFGKLAARKNLNVKMLVLVIMLFMTLGGATGVFANPVVALIPIGIILAKSLGYDAFTGFLLVYMGAYSGFNVGWANPSTLGVAQPIAELPIFSGLGVRVIIHIVNFIICYFFTLKYMARVKAEPTYSLNYEEGMSPNQYLGLESEASESSAPVVGPMTTKHMLSLAGLVVTIVVILIGAVKFKWNFDHISTSFFILAVFAGLVNDMGVNGTTKEFINGCAKMANAAFVIGFANGLSVILSNGQILNTIVYWLSIPMGYLGPIMGANFMFIANLFINLFIPSGSGQAAAVMPLMVPVADLAGITRQVAVQAFQFGDGFSNCLFPTAGTLMGSLAIAKTDWVRYARWMLPLIGAQVVLALVSLTILQSIGWMGL